MLVHTADMFISLLTFVFTIDYNHLRNILCCISKYIPIYIKKSDSGFKSLYNTKKYITRTTYYRKIIILIHSICSTSRETSGNRINSLSDLTLQQWPPVHNLWGKKHKVHFKWTVYHSFSIC